MNLPLVYAKIAELQKKQAEESTTVDTMTFNLWSIKGDSLIDSERDTHMNEYTFIALKDIKSCSMNERNKVEIRINPSAGLNEAIKDLEYMTNLLKAEGTKGLVKDVWGNVGGDTGELEPAGIEKCLRCGYLWEPKKGIKPKVCPRCKSHKWNMPKQQY